MVCLRACKRSGIREDVLLHRNDGARNVLRDKICRDNNELPDDVRGLVEFARRVKIQNDIVYRISLHAHRCLIRSHGPGV